MHIHWFNQAINSFSSLTTARMSCQILHICAPSYDNLQIRNVVHHFSIRGCCCSRFIGKYGKSRNNNGRLKLFLVKERKQYGYNNCVFLKFSLQLLVMTKIIKVDSVNLRHTGIIIRGDFFCFTLFLALTVHRLVIR